MADDAQTKLQELKEPPKRKARIRPIKRAELAAVRSEINVTPLVDVCLVLLIIFMVVTPMLARGKEVPLPLTRNHQTDSDKSQPIVAMDADGALYFDKFKVSDLDMLKTRVEEAWRADDTGAIQGKVYVKADKDLPYGKVYPLIIAMHELGVVGVDLGTNEVREDTK
jgi:biopolymer transport protein TolR